MTVSPTAHRRRRVRSRAHPRPPRLSAVQRAEVNALAGRRVPAHDPATQSGRQAFEDFLSGPGIAHLRGATVSAKHVLADGDLVAVHTHVATPQGDLATVDLFRVDGLTGLTAE